MLSEKESIKDLLLADQYDKLCEFIKQKKNRLSTLLSLSYTTDNYIKFKVIRATGFVVDKIIDQELEFIKTTISNLLWSLNDDSGSVGWSSPELLGEIISTRIDLLKEYIPLVISMLKIKETYFRAGVLWAMGRIASVEPSHIKPYAPFINMYLSDPAAETPGYAVWCLKLINAKIPEEHISHLLEDTSEIVLLDTDGSISKKTISELAKQTRTR
ncbi:MAG: DVU0298 family protein [bacterium]